MGIDRNAGGGGKYISEPGQYPVVVSGVKLGTSRKKPDGSGEKPMVTVTFETDTGQSISGYFVKTLASHQENMAKLKAACGLKVDVSSETLIGRRLGIRVEPQPMNQDGKIFMQITGFGKESDVDPNGDQSDGSDIPF